MEQRHGTMPFKSSSHFFWSRVLSVVAPNYFTEQELAEIEEINQTYFSEIESPSSFISQKNTMEEETMNSKKRHHSPSDEGNTSDYDQEKRRVKPKKNNKKPKKSESTPTPSPPPPPPPDLPIHVRNKITDLNGSDVRFVMCKKLFDTDLNPNNNRLSMPQKEIKCDFLTEIEKGVLDSNKDGRPVGFEVYVLDPSFKEFTMLFKKWEMRTTSVYNLVKNWKGMLSQNNLQKGRELYIWSFRVNEKLYFALNKKEDS